HVDLDQARSHLAQLRIKRGHAYLYELRAAARIAYLGATPQPTPALKPAEVAEARGLRRRSQRQLAAVHLREASLQLRGEGWYGLERHVAPERRYAHGSSQHLTLVGAHVDVGRIGAQAAREHGIDGELLSLHLAYCRVHGRQQ